MAAAPADIVNQAIALFGDDTPPVTGNLPTFDNSTAGVVAGQLYNATVRTAAKQFGWDFARRMLALAQTGGVPPALWSAEYYYPTNGIEVRQVIPGVVDSSNPVPVRWAVGFNLIGGVQQRKVIWCNLPVNSNPLAAYTDQPTEVLWDDGFVETVVRLLSSKMAMALAGRPETARDLLESAGEFERAAEGRLP